LKAGTRLGKDGLLAASELVRIGLFVEGVRADLAVDGVGGVDLGGLVGTVGGTLGQGGTITDDTEDREFGGVAGGGIGDGGDEGGTGGGDTGKSVTAVGLLLWAG